MAKGLDIIRRRLTSVKGTKKVVKAMEMIATTKLKHWRNTMLEARLYTESLMDIVRRRVRDESLESFPYFQENAGQGTLYLMISSNLGLCGSYNSNVINYLAKRLGKQDTVMVLGLKGVKMLTTLGIPFDATQAAVDPFDDDDLKGLIRELTDRFENKRVGKIILVYTRYVNSLVNEVKQATLLPLTPIATEDKPLPYTEQPLLEPSPLEVLQQLLPFYLKNALYSVFIESQVSEQSSRRNAMDKASDNADELKEKLELEYNKLRQSNITQEIAEIIGGSQS